MQRDIFRKVALDRLSTPEQLDQLMRITSPAGWLALAALAGLLLVLVGWTLWGTMTPETPAVPADSRLPISYILPHANVR